MKKIFYLFLLFIGSITYSQAPCATDAVMQNLLNSDPTTLQRIKDINTAIYNKKANGKTFSLPPAGSILIPVVFYIINDGTSATNISDAQIQNQLTALNNKFLDTGIKFCIATRAGTGSSIPYTPGTGVTQVTPGIIHIYFPSLTDHVTTVAAQTALMNTANSLVTPDKYLRIWVVKSIDASPTGQQTLGYAWGPDGNDLFDGIVIRSDVCGNGDANLLSGYTEGETLVHEVGHYLGLSHTFEGGCATPNNDPLLDGDLVSDTPTVAAANYTCITGTNSCPETGAAVYDLINNYMDYGNNICANSFTTGQKERMINLLATYRSNLYSTDNLIYTGGTCGVANLVSATITPDSYTICQNNPTATFHALSATTYSWNFGETGSATNTANIQNPSHTYASAAGSPYTVTLTVTNSTGQSATSSIQIFVTDCNNYTAGTDSNWYFSASNMIKFVPGSIPSFDPSFPSDKYTNLTSAVQSDNSGNLLFYANRMNVYNKNNALISPLTLSYGNGYGTALLIVPNPANSNQYYIFTNTSANQASEPESGFRKSLVTITGTNATMALATTKQPINFPAGYDTFSDGAVGRGGGVTAIKKCDGYWIITLLTKLNQQYLVCYSLTAAGLTWQSEFAFPVSPYIGQEIKASPNGNKLFLYGGTFQKSIIVDFNKAAGSFSDPVEVINSFGSTGASFSPDSKLLYINMRTEVNGSSKNVLQYNLNAANINTSKILVGTSLNNITTGTMQLGPDHKLYIGQAYGKELAMIHNPNNLSSSSNANACNFTKHGPKKNFPIDIWSGLPNLIDAKNETVYPTASNEKISMYSLDLCNKYKFFPNVCGTSFNWEFKIGSTLIYTTTNTDPVYQFTTNGTYTINLKDSTNTTVLATTTLTIANLPTPAITGNTSACLVGANTTINSTPLIPGQTYAWTVTSGTHYSMTGANTNTVSVNWQTVPGQIKVTVTDAQGCTAIATQNIALNPAPATPVISGSTYACASESNTTTNTTTIPAGQTALWTVTGGTYSSITGATSATANITWTSLPGQITLTLTNSNGCSSSVTQTIASSCQCDCLAGFTKVVSGLETCVVNNNTNPICQNLNLNYTWLYKNQTAFGTTSNCNIPPGGIRISGVQIDILNSSSEVICSRLIGSITKTASIVTDEITVSPNPSKGLFTINIQDFNDKVSIKVLDLNGRVVYKENQVLVDTAKTIDLSNLQKGVYLLKLSGKDLNTSLKIIKD